MNVPSSPHTSSHTSAGITRRLCGWLGASGTQDLRALGLWQSCRQWRAQPWSCMDAAPGCRLQRRSSANILTAWPGRVAQAPRAGRARAPWSCSPCWRPSSRTARFRDQLQLDDEANSQIADGSDLGKCRPQVTSVGDLPTSSVSAVQLIPETLCSVPTPPVYLRILFILFFIERLMIGIRMPCGNAGSACAPPTPESETPGPNSLLPMC